MHHPTDRIAHTTAFVTPVVEHWLEREISQWVHPMKDRSDDPPHHERTLYLWATSRSLAENSTVKDTTANKTNYTSVSNMSTPDQYATEIQLFAAASWLNTPICPFSPYGYAYKRQKYGPLPNTASPCEPAASCTYIKNTIEHFVPVLAR